MSGFQRGMVLLAMMGIVMTGISAVDAEEYTTITEIREETKEGWHESFWYEGAEIRAEVDVEIPDVDKVPVIRVKWPENLTPTGAPSNAEIYQSPPAGFGYSVMSQPNVLFANTSQRVGVDRYVEEGARAENSPLSAAEALAFAKAQVEPYVQDMGGFDLQLSYMDAWSRQYAVLDRTSTGDTLDYNQPLTDMGYYEISFNQTFQGIPYTQHDLRFEQSIKEESDVPGGAMGEVFVRVGSADNYSLLFAPAQWDGVLVDDLPLAPFARIRQEIRAMVESGYVRDIYRLRLVYVRLINPADIGNTWVLFPVWELSAETVQNPSAPTVVYTPDERAKQQKFGGTKLLINAQTGNCYQAQDTSPLRSYAQYLTWDEVQ